MALAAPLGPSQLSFSQGSSTSSPPPWLDPFEDTDFWHDMDLPVAAAIARCFTSDELHRPPFRESAATAAADAQDKFYLLHRRLQAKLASRAAAAEPLPLYQADYAAWEELHVALWTVQGRLNHPDYEDTIRRLVNTVPPRPPPQQSLDLTIWRVQISLHDPKAEETLRLLVAADTRRTNLDHLHGLAATLIQLGKLTEAEKMARVALAWLETTQGRASPLALSARRIIAEAVWRGGGRARRTEARRELAEVNHLIDTAICSSYGGYRSEQIKLMTDLLTRLESHHS